MPCAILTIPTSGNFLSQEDNGCKIPAESTEGAEYLFFGPCTVRVKSKSSLATVRSASRSRIGFTGEAGVLLGRRGMRSIAEAGEKYSTSRKMANNAGVKTRNIINTPVGRSLSGDPYREGQNLYLSLPSNASQGNKRSPVGAAPSPVTETIVRNVSTSTIPGQCFDLVGLPSNPSSGHHWWRGQPRLTL